MDLEQIANIIQKLHAGAAYTVVYAKDGIIKRRPVRLGVRYGNTKHMIGRHAGPLPGNGRWVIDRFVYQDCNGYKLRITNDAFGKDITRPLIQCIKLENIIGIERKGEAL